MFVWFVWFIWLYDMVHVMNKTKTETKSETVHPDLDPERNLTHWSTFQVYVSPALRMRYKAACSQLGYDMSKITREFMVKTIERALDMKILSNGLTKEEMKSL